MAALRTASTSLRLTWSDSQPKSGADTATSAEAEYTSPASASLSPAYSTAKIGKRLVSMYAVPLIRKPSVANDAIRPRSSGSPPDAAGAGASAAARGSTSRTYRLTT